MCLALLLLLLLFLFPTDNRLLSCDVVCNRVSFKFPSEVHMGLPRQCGNMSAPRGRLAMPMRALPLSFSLLHECGVGLLVHAGVVSITLESAHARGHSGFFRKLLPRCCAKSATREKFQLVPIRYTIKPIPPILPLHAHH